MDPVATFLTAQGAYHIGLGLAAIGSGLGLGMAGRIQTAMIIGCAFIEALTIYALISSFIRM